MRVLADFHHHALAESLLILFEDRLGGAVYFPAGMDWFTSDTWQFEKQWHGDAVARQYLEGIWADAQWNPGGDCVRLDPRHPGRTQRGIEYEAALETEWDLVISTLPPNDAGLHRLAKEHGAAFGLQVGNEGQTINHQLADFILSSSTLPQAGLVSPDTWGRIVSYQGVPTIVYHQEFSMDTFRHEYPAAERQTVASFVNCFPEGPSYPDFLDFARGHDQLAQWKVYGATGQPSWATERPYTDEFQAGDLGPVPDVADAMRAARIIWHTKHWSDGFGHVIHNAFAVGRPVLGYSRYYEGKLAGPLWVEGVTSFNVEGMGDGDLEDLVARLINDDELHERVSTAAAARFRAVVDFDGEAQAITQLLELVG